MRLQLAVASVGLLVMPPVVGQVCKHAGPAPMRMLENYSACDIALLVIALDRESGVNDDIAPTAPRSSDGEQVPALVCLWTPVTCWFSRCELALKHHA